MNFIEATELTLQAALMAIIHYNAVIITENYLLLFTGCHICVNVQ